MRTALSCLVLVVAVGEAAADRVCYAGTETRDTDGTADKHGLVVVHELDRKASEIRQQSWIDTNHEKERTQRYKFDATTGSFVFAIASWSGKGTLEGDAWKWTGYHASTSSADSKFTLDGKVTATALDVTTRIEMGKRVATMRWETTVFDCKDLEERKRALDPSLSATATRSCYAGTALDGDGTAVPMLLVHIVDRARVEVRYRFGDMKDDRVDLFTIEGGKAVVDRNVPAKVLGKPGAWTGYKYTRRASDAEITVEGTLGGQRAKHEFTIKRSAATGSVTLEGAKFDCADLAAKRAAL